MIDQMDLRTWRDRLIYREGINKKGDGIINKQLNNKIWQLFHESEKIGQRRSTDYIHVTKITNVEKILDVLDVSYETPYGPSDYHKNIVLLESKIKNISTEDLKTFVEEYLEIAGLPVGFMSKLNGLFDKYAAPFKIENGKMITKSNEYIYETVICPVMNLLDNGSYNSVNKDYKQAVEAYNGGNFEDTALKCGKSIEDTMKIIYKGLYGDDMESSTGCKLRDSLISKGFFNDIASKKLVDKIKNDIEIILNIRNENGGHGSSELKDVPKCIAEYELHSTASMILLLISIYEKKRS